MINPTALVPMVIDSSGRGERAYDIFSLLLKERIVILGTPINDQVANLIVAQLLWLNHEDPKREIQMFINSPGGVINSGYAIYDTMHLIEAPVSTIAVGMTASMGTILLTGATGRRYALPNATVHMHQPLGGAEGQASDIEIAAQEILRQRDRINTLIVRHTKMDEDQIKRYTDRDYYMTPDEAVALGVIDEVMQPLEATARLAGGKK